jgi:hypothetical protein
MRYTYMGGIAFGGRRSTTDGGAADAFGTGLSRRHREVVEEVPALPRQA